MPSLDIQVRAKFAEVLDGLAEVKKHAKSTTDTLSSAFDGLKTVGAGLLAGFSFAAVANELQSTVGLLASFQDGAEKAGTSVEKFSSLFYDLRASNIPVEEITAATAKLTKAMADAEDESSEIGRTFAALGVSAKDGSGKLKDATEFLREVSVAIEEYEDGANKVAIAQNIFGKSGADMIPIFKDLAEVVDRSAGVTREQAEAADEFDKSIQSLFGQLEKGRIAIFGGLIDPLNDLVTSFNDALSANLGFLESLDVLGGNLNNKIRNLFGAEDLKRSDFIARDLDRVRESIERLSKSKAPSDIAALGSMQKRAQELEAQLQALVSIEQRAAQRAAGPGEAAAPKPAAPTIGPDMEKAAAAGRSMVDALNKQLGSLRQISKLEEVNRDIAAALLKDKNSVTEADQKRLRTLAQQYDIAKRSKEAEAKISQGQSMIEQLDRQIVGLREMSKLEEVNLEITRQLEKNKRSITAADQDRIRALAEQFDQEKRMKELRAAEVEMTKIIDEAQQREADRIRDKTKQYTELAQPAEKYLEQLREITQLERDGFMDVETADKARKLIGDQIDGLNKTKESVKENENVAKEWGLTFTSSLEDVIAKTGSVRDAFTALAEDIRRMFARKLITEPLMKMLDGAMSSWGGSTGIGNGQQVFRGGTDYSMGTSLRGLEAQQGIEYGSIAPKSNVVQVTLNGSGVAMQDVTRAVRAGNDQMIAMSADQGRRG